MIPIVILAGGLGTRLNELTKSTPKSLILINEIPFVIHQLMLLKKSGFSKIHFCLGHLGEKIEHEIKNHNIFKNMNITFSYDGENQLGTGGAIKNIIDKLPNYFFLTYGDSYLLTDYKKVLNYFNNTAKSSNESLMTVYKNNNKWDKSNVIFNGKRILKYSKNHDSINMNFIDFGLSIISKNSFKLFNKKSIFDLSEYLSYQVKNNSLLGYEVDKRFHEIGSIDGIRDLEKIL